MEHSADSWMLGRMSWRMKVESAAGSGLKIAIDLENADVDSQAKSAAVVREESLAFCESSAGWEQKWADGEKSSAGCEERFADGDGILAGWEERSADDEESSAGYEESFAGWAGCGQSRADDEQNLAACWEMQVGLSDWKLGWDNYCHENSWGFSYQNWALVIDLPC